MKNRMDGQEWWGGLDSHFEPELFERHNALAKAYLEAAEKSKKSLETALADSEAMFQAEAEFLACCNERARRGFERVNAMANGRFETDFALGNRYPPAKADAAASANVAMLVWGRARIALARAILHRDGAGNVAWDVRRVVRRLHREEKREERRFLRAYRKAHYWTERAISHRYIAGILAGFAFAIPAFFLLDPIEAFRELGLRSGLTMLGGVVILPAFIGMGLFAILGGTKVKWLRETPWRPPLESWELMHPRERDEE